MLNLKGREVTKTLAIIRMYAVVITIFWSGEKGQADHIYKQYTHNNTLLCHTFSLTKKGVLKVIFKLRMEKYEIFTVSYNP